MDYLNYHDQVVSKIDTILEVLHKMKERNEKRYYNTKETCKYLGLGKSVIDKLRQNGEISYTRVGQTYLFSREDLDNFVLRNQVRYVS